MTLMAEVICMTLTPNTYNSARHVYSHVTDLRPIPINQAPQNTPIQTPYTSLAQTVEELGGDSNSKFSVKQSPNSSILGLKFLNLDFWLDNYKILMLVGQDSCVCGVVCDMCSSAVHKPAPTQYTSAVAQ